MVRSGSEDSVVLGARWLLAVMHYIRECVSQLDAAYDGSHDERRSDSRYLCHVHEPPICEVYCLSVILQPVPVV